MDQPLRQLETGPENELRRFFPKGKKDFELEEVSARPPVVGRRGRGHTGPRRRGFL